MNSAEIQSLTRKKKYKNLLEIGQQIRSRIEIEDVLETINSVKNILQQSDNLTKEGEINDRLENSTEVVMDAQVVKMSHEIIEMAISKQRKSDFKDIEYVAVLKNLLTRDGPVDFDLIGEYGIDSSNFFYGGFTTMLGSFDPEAVSVTKVQKERQQRNKTILDKEKRPDQLKKLESNESAVNVFGNVLRVISKLYQQTKKPIPYYKLIIVPNDLMKTASNAFQISFLTKDGVIGIENGEDGYPVIIPISKAEKSKLLAEQKQHSQILVGLTLKNINKFVKLYNITSPLLTCFNDLNEISQTQ